MTVWTEPRDYGQLSRWRLPVVLSALLHLCLVQVLLSAREHAVPPQLAGSSTVTVILAGPESPVSTGAAKVPAAATQVSSEQVPPAAARLPELKREETPAPARGRKTLAISPIAFSELPHLSRAEASPPDSAGSAFGSAAAGTVSAATGGGTAPAAGILRRAAPRTAGNRPPDYPSLARKRGWQGRVVLAVEVDSEGAAKEVRVENGSGHDLLDEAALRAVRGWRFEPANRDGQPVAMQVLVPVSFVLQDHS